MVLAVGLSGLFMLMASSRTALVPGRLQLMGEMAYGFVANMIKENVGTEGMRFFPFISRSSCSFCFATCSACCPITSP